MLISLNYDHGIDFHSTSTDLNQLTASFSCRLQIDYHKGMEKLALNCMLLIGITTYLTGKLKFVTFLAASSIHIPLNSLQTGGKRLQTIV